MKIERRKGSQSVAGPMGMPAPQQDSAPEVEEAPKAQAESDSVALTSTQKLGDLKAAVKAMPDVRTERVTEVKNQIEDGSYHVEAEKLAKKVVDDVIKEEILGRRNGNTK